jgi:ATP-dependent Clp protease ATP-binding subunit ClpA
VAQKESKNLADLEGGMKSAVYGQDKAVETLLDKIFVAQAGMNSARKSGSNNGQRPAHPRSQGDIN